MSFPKLIEDNTPEMIKARKQIGQVRGAKDEKEFLDLLVKKTMSDFKWMISAKDDETRIKAMADMEACINILAERLESRNPGLQKKIFDRNNEMGGFKKRLVLEDIEDIDPTDEDVEYVRAEGERLGYPAVNVGRNNEGKVYAKLLGTKEAWESQIKNAHAEQPHRDHFEDFVKAVRKGDYETDA